MIRNWNCAEKRKEKTMKFTKEELMSLVNAALAMAAEGRFTVQEKDILSKEMMASGLSDRERRSLVREALKMKASDALRVMSGMDEEQKKYAACFLAVMMAADNKFVENEIKMWKFICSACEFPEIEFAEALEYWKSH